ncbi:MAG: hypothetical protein RMX59_004600 [Nostoc sp. DedSLP05]|nr:hypothetical protein [Nostoc sp. DedSLP05]MDZ8098224.1 hypothetical protein [Nostoc sp. DedSLP01]
MIITECSTFELKVLAIAFLITPINKSIPKQVLPCNTHDWFTIAMASIFTISSKSIFSYNRSGKAVCISVD